MKNITHKDEMVTYFWRRMLAVLGLLGNVSIQVGRQVCRRYWGTLKHMTGFSEGLILNDSKHTAGWQTAKCISVEPDVLIECMPQPAMYLSIWQHGQFALVSQPWTAIYCMIVQTYTVMIYDLYDNLGTLNLIMVALKQPILSGWLINNQLLCSLWWVW